MHRIMKEIIAGTLGHRHVICWSNLYLLPKRNSTESCQHYQNTRRWTILIRLHACAHSAWAMESQDQKMKMLNQRRIGRCEWQLFNFEVWALEDTSVVCSVTYEHSQTLAWISVGQRWNGEVFHPLHLCEEGLIQNFRLLMIKNGDDIFSVVFAGIALMAMLCYGADMQGAKNTISDNKISKVCHSWRTAKLFQIKSVWYFSLVVLRVDFHWEAWGPGSVSEKCHGQW